MNCFYKTRLMLMLTALILVPATATAQLKHKAGKSTFAPAPKHFVKPLNLVSHKKPLNTVTPSSKNNDGEAPTIYGIVLNDPYDYFVASFKAENGMTVEKVYTDENLDASGAAVYALGDLYVNCLEQDWYEYITTQYVFDTKTWDLIDTREELYQSSSAACMAYDATTDRIYGIFYDDSGTEYMGFGYTTTTNPEPNYISFYEQDETPMVMAISPEGTIYAIDVNGLFLTINKETGELTNIGHTDVKPAYMQDAVIDPATGKFYWAAFTDEERGGLFEVNTTTGEATLISYFPNDEEFVGLYIPDAGAPDSAPADITDLAFNFEAQSLTGQVSYTVPTTTIGGATLSGPVTAYLVIDGKTYSMEAQPGQACTFDVTVTNNGEYTAMAYVEAAGIQSNRAKLTVWLGYDYPSAVTNLKLTKEGNNAVLTWNAPTIGIHGGYVNPDELNYVVSRTGFWTDQHVGTTFTEDMSNNVGNYSYYVRPVQHELPGEGVYSNEVYFGPEGDTAWDVPYELLFTGSDLNYCTIIDANNDGNTWAYNWGGYLACEGASSGADDDWVITPLFKLKAGQMYKLTYKAAAKMGPLNPETMEVKMGTERTIAGMTRLISSETYNGIYTNTGMEERVQYITVEADGNYCFGFHAMSANGFQLNLGSMSIEPTANISAPAAVTNFLLTPGTQGALTATISFTAPLVDLSGNELAAIGRIDILRGEEVIHSFENPDPGVNLSYTHNGAQQGNNTYKVIPYSTAGDKGMDVEGTVYCGVEVPDLPSNVVLTLNDDVATLTWDAPTTGINGGYINPDEVIYTIYEPSYGNTIADNVTGNTFSITVPITEGKQYGFSLAIGCRNAAGENPEVMVSNAVVVGNPYQLPIKESFNRGFPAYSWFLVGETMDDDGWDMVEHEGENTGFARFYGTANWGGEEQSMILGKVSLKGATNPMLRLNVASYASVGDKLLIEVANSIYGPYEVIKTITFDNPALNDWTPVEMSLADYINRDYIHVSFHAIPAAEDCNIYMDEIEIRDVLDHDAAITAFSVSDKLVEVGKTTVDVNATVANRGTEALAEGSYTVKVYAGERVIGTYQGQALQPYENWNITCKYTPLSSDPSPVCIYVEVVYDADQDLSNNKSSTYEVKVIKPILPAVELLTGVAQNGNTMLTWNEPDQSGTPVQVVTDDFEDYIPFDINRAGDWAFYDQDGLPTTTNYYFPGRNQAMAYIVMNPGMVQRPSGTLADTWPAHSGEQYMTTFCAVGGDNDDWMVTPELSGNAQTITFFAKSGSETQGHEMIEVYYSTSDNTIASMTKTGEDVYKVPYGEWTMYSIDLPQSAKYFAIRCISHDRCALMIDDVTYESAAHPLEATLVGYNVYCNGELVTLEPITEDYYLIPGIDPNAVYYVTAVYDLGESIPSNSVSIVADGIEELTLDKLQGAPIYDLQGREVLHPDRGHIYVTKGKKIVIK